MAGLPIAQFPNIVPPQIQVSTTYVGADALTVEAAVATPIEQQMSGVEGMEYMYSVNANNGMMTLNVIFDTSTVATTDQILAQMRQTQASAQLPQDVRNFGVTVDQSGSSPLGVFVLYSPNGTYDPTFLANYCYININDPMSRVPGMGSVNVYGAGQYAMRIWVLPDRLATLNITVPDVIRAVQAQNNVNPAGQIGGEPVPAGPGLYVYGEYHRATRHASGLREHRHSREFGRFDRAREGCRPGGSRFADLQSSRAF